MAAGSGPSIARSRSRPCAARAQATSSCCDVSRFSLSCRRTQGATGPGRGAVKKAAPSGRRLEHVHCAQRELRARIALLLVLADNRKARIELYRGYKYLKVPEQVRRTVLCDAAKIIESRTAEVTEEQGTTRRLVAGVAGAKRVEWIECSSCRGYDASGRVSKVEVTCGGIGHELQGREGIDVHVIPAGVLGCAERTDAPTARGSDSERLRICGRSVRPVRPIGGAVEIKVLEVAARHQRSGYG